MIFVFLFISHVVVHLFAPGGVNGFDDLVDYRGIGQGRSITQTVLLTAQDLPQDTSHDLAAASLREVINDKDGLGSGEWSNRLANLHDKVFTDLLICLIALLQRHKCIDRLASEFVSNTDHGSFSNHICHGMSVSNVYGFGFFLLLTVFKQGSFNLSGGQPVTGYVNYVVNTAADPVVSVVVTSCSISSELPPVSHNQSE